MPTDLLDETEIRSPAQIRRDFGRTITKRETELLRAGLELLAKETGKAIKLAGKIGLDPAPAEEQLGELMGDSDTGAGGLIGRFTAQINLFDK